MTAPHGNRHAMTLPPCNDPPHAAAAGRALPGGFGVPTGRATAHICDWQATTDGSELLDPVYAQYKEFILLVEARRGGAVVNFCPLIYVDQDISLIRGWLRGWPKKLGQVWMTRSYGLDHPAPAPLRAGTRMGASLAVKASPAVRNRRLAEAEITLDGSAGDELSDLAPTGLATVSLGTVAISVTGTIPPDRPVRHHPVMTVVGQLRARGRAGAEVGEPEPAARRRGPRLPHPDGPGLAAVSASTWRSNPAAAWSIAAANRA
jgi:hypothetical protein